MKDLTCPYCTHEQDPDGLDEPDFAHEVECENCEKLYQVYVEYFPSYTEISTPCLNGEDHKFKKVYGYPEYHFVNRRLCEFCGLKKEVKPGEPEYIEPEYPDYLKKEVTP